MVQLFFMWLLNFFSSSALQALPFAAVATAATLGANLYFHRSKKRTIWSTLGVFAGAYYVTKLYVYFVLPAHTGFLGGYFWHTLFALVALAAGCLIAWYESEDSRYDRRDYNYNRRGREQAEEPTTKQPSHPRLVGFAGVGLVVALLLALIVVNIAQRAQTDQRAAIAHVTQAPDSENVPKTDPHHIVMVTQSQAAYAGHQYIANAGNNMGSRYKTEPSQYTLQSIQHHLWWVAPLVYQSSWSQFNFFGNHEYDSPGYIAVDAEDPNGETKIETKYHILYSPDGWFGSNLYRHLYDQGYTDGNLVDATLELNDEWKPFWTVTITKPALTVTGDTTVKALVIDSQTGKVEPFDPGKQPEWVDRIMSQSHVKDLVSDWGRYLQAGFINMSGAGEMKPSGEPELLYNDVDQPTWLIPVTSNNGSDQSAVGIMLYSTDEQKGTFYPGLRGVGVGDAVKKDFESAPGNIQHYAVESVQLYQIDGQPTWVAIYGQDHGNGTSSYTAIGMMDAKRLNTANVIFAPDKTSALVRYADWLANNSASNGDVSQTGTPSKEITGKILRISWAPVAGVTTFYIIVEGDSHIFTATAAVNAALPLMRDGDSVKLTYLDTNQNQVPLKSLTDTTINR